MAAFGAQHIERAKLVVGLFKLLMAARGQSPAEALTSAAVLTVTLAKTAGISKEKLLDDIGWAWDEFDALFPEGPPAL